MILPEINPVVVPESVVAPVTDEAPPTL